jgi:hypothetical protein
MLDEKNRFHLPHFVLHPQPSNPQLSGSRPPVLQLSNPRSSGSQPSGSQPSGSQTSGSQPSGSQPSDSQHSGSQSSGSQSSGSQPSGSQSSGSQSSGSQPSGSQSSGSQPSGSQPSGSQPSGSQPSGSQPPKSASQAAEFGSRLYREERLIPAFGNWHPYYNEQGQPDRNGQHVKLILLELSCQKGWRVCIWGANGVGMEIDYPIDERVQAAEMWRTIDTRCLITRWNLRKMGFRDG